jgi:hypothetical protein
MALVMGENGFRYKGMIFYSEIGGLGQGGKMIDHKNQKTPL